MKNAEVHVLIQAHHYTIQETITLIVANSFLTEKLKIANDPMIINTGIKQLRATEIE